LEIQRGNYSNALERIKEALEIQQDNSSAWSALGNLQFIQENYEDSQISYETVVSLPRGNTYIHLHTHTHIYIYIYKFFFFFFFFVIILTIYMLIFIII